MTRIDDHTLDAEEWGVRLKVKQTVPQESKWIGYRAHDFIPVWGERERICCRFALRAARVFLLNKIIILQQKMKVRSVGLCREKNKRNRGKRIS